MAKTINQFYRKFWMKITKEQVIEQIKAGLREYIQIAREHGVVSISDNIKKTRTCLWIGESRCLWPPPGYKKIIYGLAFDCAYLNHYSNNIMVEIPEECLEEMSQLVCLIRIKYPNIFNMWVSKNPLNKKHGLDEYCKRINK